MTNVCGIYKIANTVTGDFYIGSAINLYRRFAEHRCHLLGNSHVNAHLQNSWNKHGENNFEFSILEYCDLAGLIEREQSYIDNEKPEYNICKIAGSCLGVKRSDETKQRISEANKGKQGHWLGKHHSEETKRRMSEAGKGACNSNFGKHPTEESKCKMSEAHSGERNFMFGQHHSEESKRKISEAGTGERNHGFGKHPSEESKRKMSETKRLRKEASA